MITAVAVAAAAGQPQQQQTMMMREIFAMQTKSSKLDRGNAEKAIECLRTLKDSERDHYAAHDRGNIVGNPDSSNTSRIGRKHLRPSCLARPLQYQPLSWGRMVGMTTRPSAFLTGYSQE